MSEITWLHWKVPVTSLGEMGIVQDFIWDMGKESRVDSAQWSSEVFPGRKIHWSMQ
jgi:hypothetical protein